jgi:hypothetical protein
MADIKTKAASAAYRDGWDRIFRQTACECVRHRHVDGFCQSCGKDNRSPWQVPISGGAGDPSPKP